MNEHDRDGVRQRIFGRGHRQSTTVAALIIPVADVGGRGNNALAVALAGGGGYVGVTKVPVPPDECPQLSRLTWSNDGRLLVHAASNGRIFVYDESGTPIYSILSQASSLVSIPTDTIY